MAISGDSRTVAVGATQVETTKKGYTRVYRSDSAPWLGLTRDSESDGTPSASADGDGADEDGIVFNNFYAGSTASIDVTVSGNNGLLDGWFDFNADGDWEDAGEQVFASTSVDVGQNNLSVAIPGRTAIDITAALLPFRTVITVNTRVARITAVPIVPPCSDDDAGSIIT